jgi:hypothetical protein
LLITKFEVWNILVKVFGLALDLSRLTH